MAPIMGREHGVVLPVRTDPAGPAGPRRREAGGPDWRRSSRGLYVRASVPLTPCQRVVEAGVLVPRFGAVTGWAALAWRGGWWFTGLRADGVTPRPVPLALSRSWIRAQPLHHICTERWALHEVEVVDGLRVHSAVRAVCFAMRYAAHLQEAIAALDMAAFHDLVSIEEADEWVRLHPSYTGIEQARQAVAGAVENAWSPAEVAMRETWAGAGFPTPLANRPVFDLAGRHVGTPDLIDPATGVVGEYDGAPFHGGGQRARDLAREHDFRSLGLEPVTMVAADRQLPGPFLARLRAAYASAQARPATERAWTVELPPWWRPTFTVAQRRALSDDERRIWLRHRAEAPQLQPLAG